MNPEEIIKPTFDPERVIETVIDNTGHHVTAEDHLKNEVARLIDELPEELRIPLEVERKALKNAIEEMRFTDTTPGKQLVANLESRLNLLESNPVDYLQQETASLRKSQQATEKQGGEANTSSFETEIVRLNRTIEALENARQIAREKAEIATRAEAAATEAMKQAEIEEQERVRSAKEKKQIEEQTRRAEAEERAMQVAEQAEEIKRATPEITQLEPSVGTSPHTERIDEQKIETVPQKIDINKMNVLELKAKLEQIDTRLAQIGVKFIKIAAEKQKQLTNLEDKTDEEEIEVVNLLLEALDGGEYELKEEQAKLLNERAEVIEDLEMAKITQETVRESVTPDQAIENRPKKLLTEQIVEEESVIETDGPDEGTTTKAQKSTETKKRAERPVRTDLLAPLTDIVQMKPLIDKRSPNEQSEQEIDRINNPFKYLVLEQIDPNNLNIIFGARRLDSISVKEINRIMGEPMRNVTFRDMQNILEEQNYTVHFSSNGYLLQLINAEEVSDESGRRIYDENARYRLVDPQGAVVEENLGHDQGNELMHEKAREYQLRLLFNFEFKKDQETLKAKAIEEGKEEQIDFIGRARTSLILQLPLIDYELEDWDIEMNLAAEIEQTEIQARLNKIYASPLEYYEGLLDDERKKPYPSRRELTRLNLIIDQIYAVNTKYDELIANTEGENVRTREDTQGEEKQEIIAKIRTELAEIQAEMREDDKKNEELDAEIARLQLEIKRSKEAKNVKEFNMDFIREKLFENLKGIKKVTEIRREDIVLLPFELENKIGLTIKFTATKFMKKKEITIRGTLINKTNGIGVREGYDVQTNPDWAEGQVRKLLDEHIGSMNDKIIEEIEEMEGRKVQKIEIANQKLKVTFK